jgi:methionyl-tRNA formyltransferase
MRIIFLGTPAVAAQVLEKLYKHPSIQIVGVVSQPPSRRLRGGSSVPSPVHEKALLLGLDVATPENAHNSEFLEWVKFKQPDFCVTAAYGQILSESFLNLSPFGTLNIHPSLLPLMRGAAPVQRTLEAGHVETGVSVVKTVKAMDAGPILAQKKITIDENIQAPELLSTLFEMGAELLLSVASNYVAKKTVLVEQNHELKTQAKKMSSKEGFISHFLNENVLAMHNKVRGFVEWPGVRFPVEILNSKKLNQIYGGSLIRVWKTKIVQIVDIEKIVEKTKEKIPENIESEDEFFFANETLCFKCKDSLEKGLYLGLIELQLPSKKPILAKDFWNSLRSSR